MQPTFGVNLIEIKSKGDSMIDGQCLTYRVCRICILQPAGIWEPEPLHPQALLPLGMGRTVALGACAGPMGSPTVDVDELPAEAGHPD